VVRGWGREGPKCEAGGVADGGRGRQIVTRNATQDALLPSRAAEQRRAAQVVGGEDGERARRVAGERGIARPPQAVEPLAGAEYRLHRSPPPRDQIVAALLPMRQPGDVLVAPVHDAVLDARSLEPRPALLVFVGLVGIDRGLVAADQTVGNLAVVDLGGSELGAAQQSRGGVDPPVSLET